MHSYQAGRWMPFLDPDTFRVDDRTPVELIEFVTAFSSLLVYNNETGPVGNWDTFFIGDLVRIPGDVSFLIAKMASVDAKREYLEIVGLRDAEPPDLLKEIHRSLKRLDYWLQSLALAKSGKDEKTVEQKLSALLEDLIRGNVKYQTANLPEWVEYLKNSSFGDKWSRLSAGDGNLIDEVWNTAQLGVSAAADYSLLEIFGLVNRTTRVMSERSAGFLEESLGQPNHAPHAALLLTFLKLYQLVQADLNKMTRRHLNFYFNTVLRLAERASSPDTAHVFFELVPGTAPFVLARAPGSAREPT